MPSPHSSSANLRLLSTEKSNPASADLDRKSALEIARIINRQDARVAAAVKCALPNVAIAIDLIASALREGGRLIYVGTGTSGRIAALDAAECPPTFGVPPETVQGVIAGGYDACYKAVEASEDDREAGAKDLQSRGITANDAVVGIAASGRGFSEAAVAETP